MDYNKLALELHEKLKGKIEVSSKVKLETKEDLSTAYTPGVAQPCREIHKDKSKVYDYTSKSNTIAIVTDGTSVLGLGDIGPEAALPVMEGKSILFKTFGDVNTFPICLKTKDVDEIVNVIKLMEPGFGGINLEDIAAPRCFEIQERLQKELDIPVFHDDQQGTAVIALTALINALKVVDKKMEEIEVVVSGAGAAGIAVAKMLLNTGIKNLVVCDSKGILSKSRKDLNPSKKEIALLTNNNNEEGLLEDAMKGKDVFIGVSGPNIVTKEMVTTMNDKSIVFALANPIPEIMPEEAKKGGAFIVGTGRSDFPNQVNNILAFPGIFRGALDVRASEINEEMKQAAAYAIANAVSDEELCADFIIPKALDKTVSVKVAEAVRKAAIETGVNRI